MHRPTGVMNPDTPLGHHVGQDVGHISSTVIGSSLRLSGITLEASAFHGEEPEPMKVDLPMGPVNSYAARAIAQFTPHIYAMASAAYVKAPEADEPALDHIWRYSASLYRDRDLSNGWMLHTALVWGVTNGYDQASALNSFLHEIWLHKDRRSFWTRLGHSADRRLHSPVAHLRRRRIEFGRIIDQGFFAGRVSLELRRRPLDREDILAGQRYENVGTLTKSKPQRRCTAGSRFRSKNPYWIATGILRPEVPNSSNRSAKVDR
jgi:hypothetical protein